MRESILHQPTIGGSLWKTCWERHILVPGTYALHEKEDSGCSLATLEMGELGLDFLGGPRAIMRDPRQEMGKQERQSQE